MSRVDSVEIESSNPNDSIEVYKNANGDTKLWIIEGRENADIVLDHYSTNDLTLIINALCGYVLSRIGEGVSK